MRILLSIFLLFIIPSGVVARVIDGLERWQGEIRVTEPLRVEKEGQLLIAPGTRVLVEAEIEIAGGLQATDVEFSGQNWPGLILKGTSSQTWLKNCRVAGAQTGITVIGGEPQLTGMLFENNRIGLELRQKSNARIENSTFRKNSRVGLFIKDDVTSVVRGNRFEQQGKFGAYVYRALPQQFTENLFVDNPTGLMISHFGSDLQVKNNDFRNNKTGIKVDRTARPQIVGNRIEKNQTGIELYRRSDPLVELNLLKANRRAIHISFSSYPRIRHNDFIGNRRALILELQSSKWEEQKGAGARKEQISTQGAFGGQKKNQVSEEQRGARGLDGTVDARENWWGEQETAQLRSLGPEANLNWIDDGRDQPLFEEAGRSYPLDLVRWAPFSSRPHIVEVLK
jgi:nitrous oxidase accessory protein NosD